MALPVAILDVADGNKVNLFIHNDHFVCGMERTHLVIHITLSKGMHFLSFLFVSDGNQVNLLMSNKVRDSHSIVAL